MGKADSGHWWLGFRGSKDAIVGVYEYLISARNNFYRKSYPEIIRDFLETKEFLVMKEGDWKPCRVEDCDDSDRLILRGHSITPRDVRSLDYDLSLIL